MKHKPVLLQEVLKYLAPKAGENFIDGTVGQGGHTAEILKLNAPDGKVLGMDWDAQQIENAKETLREFGDRVILENSSYVHIKEAAQKHGLEKVDGILLDLGFSSWQLENSAKGFSFQKDEPLDMRYGGGELTAAEIVNTYSENALEKIFSEYGEEKFSWHIARNIVGARQHKKIASTLELASVIKQAVPSKYVHGRIHYATRVFQALRIAVNAELQNVQEALPEALSILSPGGRLMVISFHSLEDRIVKNFMRDQAKLGAGKIATKKPVEATEAEAKENPRARSAKLRTFIKS